MITYSCNKVIKGEQERKMKILQRVGFVSHSVCEVNEYKKIVKILSEKNWLLKNQDFCIVCPS
jgi:hypothetical protein